MKVKKEVTVAVIIGLLLGVVVVGGILRARKALMNLPSLTKKNEQALNKTTDTANKELFLEIDTSDNQVVKTGTINITGKTLPGTYIVINGEAGDSIIVPNDIGSFSQEVTLVKGGNTIHITVYEENGNKKEADLTVVYTTVEI